MKFINVIYIICIFEYMYVLYKLLEDGHFITMLIFSLTVAISAFISYLGE